ncbi:MAG: hypothetical protein H0W02_13750 [Ktedonobacteraceae bacterium]|nr:hypothetical protein [Ktedonobacteraceae bacterium]
MAHKIAVIFLKKPKRLRLKTFQLLSTLVALIALVSMASAIFGISFIRAALPASHAAPHQTVKIQQRQILPVFVHKALHWTQTVSSYITGGRDPENGQGLTGEIWMLTGNDGLPVSLHVRYIRSDGTMVQDIVETRTAETDYFGGAYGNRPCTTGSHSMSQQQLQSALPIFINTPSLTGNGYLRVRTSSFRAFPGTIVSGSIQPEQVYTSSTIAQSWQADTTYASNMRDVKKLDLDGRGRLLREEVQLFDRKNTLIQDNWHTYGSLQVYNPALVSPTIFTLGAQEKGSCHA